LNVDLSICIHLHVHSTDGIFSFLDDNLSQVHRKEPCCF
jgi:hypothetical protein